MLEERQVVNKARFGRTQFNGPAQFCQCRSRRMARGERSPQAHFGDGGNYVRSWLQGRPFLNCLIELALPEGRDTELTRSAGARCGLRHGPVFLRGPLRHTPILPRLNGRLAT